MVTLRLYSDPREASWTTPARLAARRDRGHEDRSGVNKNCKGGCGVRDVGCGVQGEQSDVAGRAQSTGRRAGTLSSDALGRVAWVSY